MIPTTVTKKKKQTWPCFTNPTLSITARLLRPHRSLMKEERKEGRKGGKNLLSLLICLSRVYKGRG